MAKNKQQAIISLVTFVESIIDQWQSAMATVDPEYGYQNEIRESEALKLKQEYRELLSAVLEGGDANA